MKVSTVRAGRYVVAAGLGLLLGCGDNDKLAVDFQGNVVGVQSPSARKASRPQTWMVRVAPERVGRFWLPAAVAQSAACSAGLQDALADVLVCAETVHGGVAVAQATETPTATPTATGSPAPTETPGTPTPTPSPEIAPAPTLSGGSVACRRVEAGECLFSTQIQLAEDGDPAVVFFVVDGDQDGRAGEGERTAVLTSELPRLCNGDVIEIPNVTIDFTSQVATAGRPIGKQIDACPPGTRTPSPSRTPATPTVTGTPPTPTPTETPAYYSASAGLNRPPSSLLAFLSSLAVVGLLLPRRRSRQD